MSEVWIAYWSALSLLKWDDQIHLKVDGFSLWSTHGYLASSAKGGKGSLNIVFTALPLHLLRVLKMETFIFIFIKLTIGNQYNFSDFSFCLS